MDKLQQHLLDLSDQFDKQGMYSCATSIDKLIKSASLPKVAQYVGVIGYVLRQNRAMANCVRKKRVASEGSMQEIVLGCLKEYQDGQQYGETEWASKYAQVIQHDPGHFEESHIALIDSIQEENNIIEHIENIRTASENLKDHDTNDEILDKVVDNVDTLHGLLKQEDTTCPFKVAAPRSQRKWWQRIFSPSWTRRGNDKDAQLEMENIIDNLREMSLLTQNMKTYMNRVKQNITQSLQAYNAMSQDEAMQDDASTVDQVVSKINELNPGNWSRSIVVIQQLDWMLNSQQIKSPYTRRAIETVKSLSGSLKNGAEQVYNYINDIQTNMYALRRRKVVRGPQNTYSPYSFASPANEFEQLERILGKLYENPFDEEALHYAQRAHSRLDDKLRSVNIGADVELDDYVKTPTSPSFDPISPVSLQRSSDPSDPSDPNTQDKDQVAQKSNVDDSSIQSIVDQLFLGNYTDTMKEFSRIIQLFSNYPQLQQTANILTLILDGLESKSNSPSVNPVGEDLEDPQPTSLADPSAEKIYIDKNGGNLEKVREQIDQDLDNEDNQAGSMYQFLKIADAIDKELPDVAHVLDQYIEEYLNESDNLKEFPQFGRLATENILETVV